MKTIVLAAFVAAIPFVTAQDQKAAGQDPGKKDPAPVPMASKAAEHAHLKLLAGNWDVAVKCWPAPGGAPIAMAGTDESKLCCDGMWLVTKVEGIPAGTFQGYGLTGYDTNLKKFVGVWVDSANSSPAWSEGEYDAKAKTFAMRGEGPGPNGGMAKTRSACEFKGDDTRIEKCWTTGADGKEFQCMELTFTRSKPGGAKPIAAAADKSAKPADAAAGGAAGGAPNPKDPMHAHLKRAAGTWTGKAKMQMPGAPVEESAMTLTETLICNDLWVRSDATGTFGGQPFEGHGIFGYDTNKKQFVSFWVDGGSTGISKANGTCDADGKVFTLTGECTMAGAPIKTSEVSKFDGDKRTCEMKMKTADGKDAGSCTFELTRQKSEKSEKIDK